MIFRWSVWGEKQDRYEMLRHSVGTFSTRFSRSVGLSPSHYRRHNNVVPDVLFDEPSSDRAAGTITGRNARMSAHCPTA